MKKIVLATLMLAGTALPSMAQDFGSMDMTGHMMGLGQTTMGWSMVCEDDDACYDDTPARPSISFSEQARVTAGLQSEFKRLANITPGDMTYRPDPAVRRELYQRYLPPETQAEFRASYGGRDLIDMLNELASPYGFKENSLPDAMAIWAMAANSIIEGEDYTPHRETSMVVKAGFALGLMQTPEAMGMSDAEKQRFAEQLLIFAFAYEQGMMAKQTNPAAYRALQNAARKHARQMGIDFNALELVHGEGFVVRSR